MKLVVFNNNRFYLREFVPMKIYHCEPVSRRGSNEVIAYDDSGDKVFLFGFFLYGSGTDMYAIFGDDLCES